jgi:hypothetical protein
VASETRTLLYWDGGTMEFDASVKETFTHDAEMTRYPIELDSDRVDHVRVQPTEITISAIVSNTPAREGLTHMDDVAPVRGFAIVTREPMFPRAAAAGMPTTMFGQSLTRAGSSQADIRLWSGPVRRVTTVYAELLQMQREARALTILTAIGNFDDMVLRSLSVSRDAASANALDFTATFQQLAVTSLALETLKAPDPRFARSKRRKDKGLQSLSAQTVRFDNEGGIRVLESEGIDEQTRQQALNLGLGGTY